MTRRIFSGEAKIMRQRFIAQRAKAKQRGIPMLMTFDQWRGVWGDRWHLRGRHRGELVMSRFGDTGPYSLTNVRLVPAELNAGESGRGTRNYRAKLTPADVVRIRKLRAAGMPLWMLVPMFGVKLASISKVARGERWKQVPGPRVAAAKLVGGRWVLPGSEGHRPAP